MAIWRMHDTGPKPVPQTPLPLEQQLEDMIFDDPTVVGADILIVGRQVTTRPYSGVIDILGVDEDARVHVLELKRDKSPRDVVAQTLDYGSWASNLALDDISEMYAESHDGDDFEEAFVEKFGHPLPDVFNPDQRLTIVASELDDVSDRIVQYLAKRYAVPINAVFFRHFTDSDRSYLARTWLLTPEEAAAAQSRSTKRGPVKTWNGRDFYVILGKLEHGAVRWELARRYSYLSAGGGEWYWKPLRNLKPGHRVLAYVGGAGYVGIGEVTGTVRPASEATVKIDGQQIPLTEAPDVYDNFRQRAATDDPNVTEYVVPVDWIATRSVEKAVSERGLFASQVTACKLKDDRTIQIVEDAFEIEPEAGH